MLKASVCKSLEGRRRGIWLRGKKGVRETVVVVERRKDKSGEERGIYTPKLTAEV